MGVIPDVQQTVGFDLGDRPSPAGDEDISIKIEQPASIAEGWGQFYSRREAADPYTDRVRLLRFPWSQDWPAKDREMSDP